MRDVKEELEDEKEKIEEEKEEILEPTILDSEYSKTSDLKDNEQRIEELENLAGKKQTTFDIVFKEITKDKMAMVSLIIFVILILGVAIGSLFFNQKEAMKVNIINSYLAPGEEGYILGTDQGGVSIFAQLILGARNTLLLAFVVTVVTTVLGGFIGLASGYYGGRIDNIIMRIIDFITILPTMMIIIVFIIMIPNYSVINLAIIISIFGWPGMARLTRSKALSESRKDYVSASKTMGTNDLKIMLTKVLPNISSILIVDATLSFAGNIGLETGLSFLGLGFPLGTPSLGTLIGLASAPDVIQDRQYIWIPAALFILVLTLCINYVGQALRRSSDARQRRA